MRGNKKYRNIDHFLRCAYVDEEHVIVAHGSLYIEERGKTLGLTPQEKAQYYATARYQIEQVFENDKDRLNCIKAKYGVGETFIAAVAYLTQQMMVTGQTDTEGCCLFELVKYTYDKKKNLRQLCADYGMTMNALLKDKKFIDGYIAAIEYRAMEMVEGVLQPYLKEDMQLVVV